MFNKETIIYIDFCLFSGCSLVLIKTTVSSLKHGEVKMRTIKDPKKKPEIRRRVEPVESAAAEEEDHSTKSTPPKKRKTAKSPKDDCSSFNDSGSFVDNQSDIISEKSSVIGDDDVSDVSSYKSTPPKKRNYNRVLDKSPDVGHEINGDIHISPAETSKLKESSLRKSSPDKKSPTDKKSAPEKKPRPRKKNKSGDSIINDNHSTNTETAEKTTKGKKPTKPKKESDIVKNGEINDTDKKKVVPRKKKVPENDDSSPNKKTSRKRKLSGAQAEQELPSEKVVEDKPVPPKKVKKPVSKKVENIPIKTVDDEPNIKPVKKTPPKKSKPKLESKPVKETEQTVVDKVGKSYPENGSEKTVETKQLVEPVSDILKENNHVALYGSDTDGEHSESDLSDFETSFESVNSHRDEAKLFQENHDGKPEGSKEEDSRNDGENKYEEVKIKCEHCGYVSRSKGGHTRHLRKCKPEVFGLDPEIACKPKIHHCEKCDYSAPKRLLVINHMRQHGIYQCKRCQFRTDSDDVLTDHAANEHKDRSDCKFCKLCNRYVKCSEVPLEKHMEECQGRIPFRCPECSKEFQYESSLKCHVVSHYPDQPKLFSCNQCDYKSNYKANLKKHIRHIHENRGEKNIKCPECEKMFFTEDNMKRHLKLHSEDRPFKCEFENCDKAFKTANGLKLHKISHKQDRPFPCDIEGCDKSFKTKRYLILHMNETHQNAPKNFKCQEENCTMAFYKKNHLDRHMDAHKGCCRAEHYKKILIIVSILVLCGKNTLNES